VTQGAPVLPAPEPTPFVSQSQITTWCDCKRKWAWKYVEGEEDPQTDAAALGDEVDAGQLQPYLRDGREFDFVHTFQSWKPGYIAAAGVSYLPPPKSPGLEVQKEVVLASPSGLRDDFEAGRSPVARFGYFGFIDLWLPDGSMMPGLPPREPGIVIPCVGDFKTTKDFKWRKKEAALRKDPQAVIYAMWAMLTTGSRVVDLVWLYFRTVGTPVVQPTYVRVTAEEITPRFLELDAIAQEIVATKRAGTRALDLPPSPMSCGKFGGCPYQDDAHCNLGPADDIAALLAGPSYRKRRLPTIQPTAEELMPDNEPTAKQSMMDRLRAKRAAESGGAAPAPTPAAPSLMGCSDRDVPPAPVDQIPAPFREPAAGINPPEQHLPPAPAVGAMAAPPVTEEQAAKRKRRTKAEIAADEAAAAAAKASSSIAPTAAPTAAAPAPAPITTTAYPNTAGETVTVTWAKEKYSPIAYNDFDVGPFERTFTVPAGEDVGKAIRKVYAELCIFAIEAIADKAAGHKRTIDRLGGRKEGAA
jgi:hypothetical protein